MPTLVRFLMTLAALAALAAAAIFALASFVEPQTREMTIRIPSDRLAPRPIAPMPTPSPPAGAEEDSREESTGATVQ